MSVSRNGEDVQPLSFHVPYIRLWSPGDMITLVGLPGSGKTGYGVLMAEDALRSGYLVYSNVVLHDPFVPDKNYYLLSYKNRKDFINEMWGLVDHIVETKDYRNRFLLVDESASIADAQKWEKAVETSDIWKQLNKLSITAVFINQSWGMTYNRIRENSVKKLVCEQVKLPLIMVNLSALDVRSSDKEKFNNICTIPCDLYPSYNMFNTRQIMYARSLSNVH